MEHHHKFDDLKNGVKYDDNKPRLAEMLVDMREPLLALCKVWEYGASKYTPDNWKKVDNGKDRYTNAMLRHLFAEEDSPVDDESLLLHASHIAFNALARLYFILQERQLKTLTVDNKEDDVKGPFSIYFGTREVGKVYDQCFAEKIQSLIDVDEKSHIVDWKDHIADFYECAPQGLYNLEPGAINEEEDRRIRDIVNSYFTNPIKERKEE